MTQILYNIVVFPISDIIDFLFTFFSSILGDVYFAIFIVSFFISLACLPMYMSAEKLQDEERQIQEKMKPQVQSIKKNFKGDEQFMLLKTCYRQHKYNPIMALRNTLSLLIQVPFFIAAYLYFSHSEILHNTAFINGQTLAQPDGILSIFGLSINILPILMTIINIISAEIYANKKPLKDRIQMYSFALIFLILLYNSPAGLVIYWTFNNIFSLIKNIGLKQKDPLRFLKNLCNFIALLLVLKISYVYSPYDILYKYQCYTVGIITIYYFSQFIRLSIKERINKFVEDINVNDFSIYILSTVVMSTVIGILIPLITVSSSMDFISLYNKKILNTLFVLFTQTFGLYVFWPIIIYYFASKKYRNLLVIIFSTAAILGIVNFCMYNGELGILSFDFVFMAPQYGALKLFKDIIITLVLTCLIILCFVKHKIIYIKNALISILLGSIIFSTVNGYAFNKKLIKYNRTELNNDNEIGSIKPIKLSNKGKNVLIIFIDRAIGSYAREIFEEDLALKNKFIGFTLYPNIVSYYGQTTVAYPPMIGGYEYTPENMEKRPHETYEQKTNEAYLVLPTIFKNNKYNSLIVQPHSYYDNGDFSIYKKSGINIFSFPNNEVFYSNLTYNAREKSVLQELTRGLDIREQFMVKRFLKFSNYMTFPSFIKVVYDLPQYDFDAPWDAGIIADYKQLVSLKYATDIENSNENYFVIFNSTVTHINKYDKPYSKELKYIDKETFYEIAEYFDILRKNNAFDNTRIIIVSDHGHWGQESRYLDDLYLKYNPLLLFKDFNSKSDLNFDFEFMTNADAPILAVKDIIQNPINPYTGKSLLQSVDKSEVKILSGWIGPQIQKANKYTPRIWGESYYRVHDNIFEKNNWN